MDSVSPNQSSTGFNPFFASSQQPPLFEPYHPTLPYLLDSRPDEGIRNTIEVIIRLADDNSRGIDKAIAKLEDGISLLTLLAGRTPEAGPILEGVTSALQEVTSDLQGVSRSMGRALKRPPFVHPHVIRRLEPDPRDTIPTSAISNAKDRDLPSLSSRSTVESDSIGEVNPERTDADAAQRKTSDVGDRAADDCLHAALEGEEPVEEADDELPQTKMAPSERVWSASPSPSSPLLSPIASPLYPNGLPSTDPEGQSNAESPPQGHETATPTSIGNEIRAASPAAEAPAPEIPPTPADVPVREHLRDAPAPRKSTRTRSVAPTPTSCTISTDSGRCKQAKPIRRRAANIAPVPRRNEPLQLKMGDRTIRIEGAEWPKKGENTLRGTAIEVSCVTCKGRCHICCAALDDNIEDWQCHDCRYAVETTGTALEQIDSDKCIRKDCILRAKQKRKYEPGDEEQYAFDRVIGRRPAPDYTPQNRSYQYLFRWNGINWKTRKMWGIEDSTWESADNLPDPKTNIFDFLQACVAEGMDGRTYNDEVLLLAEARTKWNEQGELEGDGWSKQVSAAMKAAEAKREASTATPLAPAEG